MESVAKERVAGVAINAGAGYMQGLLRREPVLSAFLALSILAFVTLVSTFWIHSGQLERMNERSLTVIERTTAAVERNTAATAKLEKSVDAILRERSGN